MFRDSKYIVAMQCLKCLGKILIPTQKPWMFDKTSDRLCTCPVILSNICIKSPQYPLLKDLLQKKNVEKLKQSNATVSNLVIDLTSPEPSKRPEINLNQTVTLTPEEAFFQKLDELDLIELNQIVTSPPVTSPEAIIFPNLDQLDVNQTVAHLDYNRIYLDNSFDNFDAKQTSICENQYPIDSESVRLLHDFGMQTEVQTLNVSVQVNVQSDRTVDEQLNTVTAQIENLVELPVNGLIDPFNRTNQRDGFIQGVEALLDATISPNVTIRDLILGLA